MGTCGIEEGKFYYQNPNDMIVVISDNKEEQIKQGLFIKELLKRLNITKIESYVDIGIKDRPDLSACTAGLIYSAFCVASALILAKTNYGHVNLKVNYINNQNAFSVTSSCVLEISILDIIISKIIANNKHKENSVGKRK